MENAWLVVVKDVGVESELAGKRLTLQTICVSAERVVATPSRVLPRLQLAVFYLEVDRQMHFQSAGELEVVVTILGPSSSST